MKIRLGTLAMRWVVKKPEHALGKLTTENFALAPEQAATVCLFTLYFSIINIAMNSLSVKCKSLRSRIVLRFVLCASASLRRRNAIAVAKNVFANQVSSCSLWPSFACFSAIENCGRSNQSAATSL